MTTTPRLHEEMTRLIAGIAGSFVPILLGRIGADPAVASSIFVTTFTDVFGFLLLLGLGTWVLVG